MSFSPSADARGLLYQDQQESMLRRALEEEKIMSSKKAPSELTAPSIKMKPPKAGTGFGGSAKNKNSLDPSKRLAEEQAKVVRRDGVLRMNSVLTEELADRLREYVLEQKDIAEVVTSEYPSLSRAYYGVENSRASRTDLQLSLLRDTGVENQEGNKDSSHTLADALLELLGKDGTLRPIYENLVTTQGELYEMAAVVTNPGSKRQMVHPDLPYKSDAPLYVIFLALQDVTEDMGPTTFLLKTQTEKGNAIFEGGDDAYDEYLAKANCRLATLKKGDAVLFDARVLHCGNANDAEKGQERVLFNFSFRNPKVVGDLGYKGSIRPGYVGAMTVGDVGDALATYAEDKTSDPFAQYGDGLV